MIKMPNREIEIISNISTRNLELLIIEGQYVWRGYAGLGTSDIRPVNSEDIRIIRLLLEIGKLTTLTDKLYVHEYQKYANKIVSTHNGLPEP